MRNTPEDANCAPDHAHAMALALKKDDKKAEINTVGKCILIALLMTLFPEHSGNSPRTD